MRNRGDIQTVSLGSSIVRNSDYTFPIVEAEFRPDLINKAEENRYWRNASANADKRLAAERAVIHDPWNARVEAEKRRKKEARRQRLEEQRITESLEPDPQYDCDHRSVPHDIPNIY